LASLARAEQVIALLRTRYISEGWKIDEDAAEKTLAYCRKCAWDGSDPDDERLIAIHFFGSHGISLDWIFRGDIAGLICNSAKHSQRAGAIVDAELVELHDKIFTLYEKAHEHDREMSRLQTVWFEEVKRREEDRKSGASCLTSKEIWEIVK